MAEAGVNEEVLGLFDDGVSSFEEVAGQVSQWDRPACGEWSAADTVRHVLAVADWYHEWLDRAEAGVTSRPFPVEEMPSRNQVEVANRADIAVDDAVRQFVTRARSYGERVDRNWDLPYAYPFGHVTAGLHLGVAAAEWNLHAWDLSGEFDARHEPSDPVGLFRAAGSCFAASQGGVRGRVTGWIVPIGARVRPWPSLLERSGR